MPTSDLAERDADTVAGSLAALERRIEALEREDRKLRSRVEQALMDRAATSRRGDPAASLGTWLSVVAMEVEERLSGAPSAKDRRRLAALASLLGVLEEEPKPSDLPVATLAEPRPSVPGPPTAEAAPARRPPPEPRAPSAATHRASAPTAGANRNPRLPSRSPRRRRGRAEVPPAVVLENPLGVLLQPLDDALGGLGRAAGRVTSGLGDALGTAFEPLERALARWGRAWGWVSAGIGVVLGSAFSAVPLPGVVRKWLWVGKQGARRNGEAPLQAQMKKHFASLLWMSIIVSVLAHYALFAFWPTMAADDLSFASEELTALELPPEVDVPPPPQQIARPATPVIAPSTVEEDITISPTTFDDNPVEDMPPPPDVTSSTPADRGGPSFTPFTVAPRILNGPEVAEVMQREYPPVLREAGIGGEVILWVHVDERGNPEESRVFRTSGFEEIDQAARRVVQRIRFSPALNGDRNVPVWIQFPLTFRVR